MDLQLNKLFHNNIYMLIGEVDDYLTCTNGILPPNVIVISWSFLEKKKKKCNERSYLYNSEHLYSDYLRKQVQKSATVMTGSIES